MKPNSPVQEKIMSLCKHKNKKCLIQEHLKEKCQYDSTKKERTTKTVGWPQRIHRMPRPVYDF